MSTQRKHATKTCVAQAALYFSKYSWIDVLHKASNYIVKLTCTELYIVKLTS